MQDNDAKFRFACLEGLYHITFALQEIVLINFKDIFETLVTKVTDMDLCKFRYLDVIYSLYI